MKQTIKIHNESTASAEGSRSNGNCKPVFCIDTGKVYASVADCAEEIGSDCGSLSRAIRGARGVKTCKGKRYCFVSDIMSHLNEISESITVRETKASAYEAITARQEAIRKANEKLVKHRDKCAKLREQLATEMRLAEEAEREVAAFEENNSR